MENAHRRCDCQTGLVVGQFEPSEALISRYGRVSLVVLLLFVVIFVSVVNNSFHTAA